MQEVGLRETKKLATRRALTSAARRLVHEDGLDAVTVERICAAAGVSVRTFFNYFDTKELALLGPDTELGTTAARSAFVAGGPTGDLLADLFELIDLETAFDAEGRAEIVSLFEVLQQEPRILLANLGRLQAHELQLRELIAERLQLDPAGNARAAHLASMAMNLVFRASLAWFADDSLSLASHFALIRTEAVALVTGSPLSPTGADARSAPSGVRS